ncbi:GDSL esterase/lipase-like protein [Tanacetum coccineum]
MGRRFSIIRLVDYDEIGVFKGLVPQPEAFSHGLYTFDIGQNDLTGGLLLNLSIDQVKAFIPEILGQFRTVVKDVHLPTKPEQTDETRCANPFEKLARFFNRKLKDLMNQLHKELHEAAITYVDIYRARYTHN